MSGIRSRKPVLEAFKLWKLAAAMLLLIALIAVEIARADRTDCAQVALAQRR